MPKIFRGGAVQRAANISELRFRINEIPLLKGTNHLFNSITDDRPRGAISLANDDVLTMSFFCTLNVRHTALTTLVNTLVHETR